MSAPEFAVSVSLAALAVPTRAAVPVKISRLTFVGSTKLNALDSTLLAVVDVSTTTSLALLITNVSLPLPPTKLSTPMPETSVSVPLLADKVSFAVLAVPARLLVPVNINRLILVGNV